MKLFKFKPYKNNFKRSSISFPEYSLKTFNVNTSAAPKLKRGTRNIISFNKFKVDEKTLKLQQIKAEVIKLKKKFNLINLTYKDITTKQSKKGVFKIYLNSPLITQIN